MTDIVFFNRTENKSINYKLLPCADGFDLCKLNYNIIISLGFLF